MVKFWVVAVVCTSAFAGTIVVPNAEKNVPGNDVAGGPSSPTPSIFQELFGSGQFTSTGPIEITKLSWRAAPGMGPVDIGLGNVSLYLSTSPNFPNSSGPLMSTTFANNVGPDNTLVYSGTNVTLSDAGCSGPGVCPFDLNFNFTTPFNYNPAHGRLLAEFVFTGLELNSANGQDFQDFSAPGGSVAQVFEAGSTTATTGSFDYSGVITQLTFVPEPASWLMMASAAVLAAVRKQRFGKRG
jgi:hypothetical protein